MSTTEQDAPTIFTPPYHVKPDSWALNQHFLDAIQRQQALLSQHGYIMQWGLELEFIPQPFESRSPLREMDLDELQKMSRYEDVHNRMFTQIDAQTDPIDMAQYAENLIAYVQGNNADLKTYYKQCDVTQRQVLKALRDYKKTLNDQDSAKAELAHMNLYLAGLHLYPTAQGGLRDIIIPRFGSYGIGIGWWDDKGVAELRLPPLSDYKKFIQDYHVMMQMIMERAQEARLIPNMTATTGQLHFSVWDKNGRNIMGLQNEQDHQLAQQMMTGIYTCFDQCAQLINDHDPKDALYSVALSAGPSRDMSLRTERLDSWEFRRDYHSNYMHLARDIALIMSGVAYGLFGIDNDQKYREERKMDIAVHPMPIVKDSFFRVAYNPMKHVLASCILQPDGLLKTTDLTLEAIRHAIATLSKVGHEDYTVQFLQDEAPATLNTISGWISMLESLSFREDGQLDTDQLGAEMRAHFKPLRMVGQHYKLFGQEYQTAYGTSVLLTMMRRFAQSSVLQWMFPDEEQRVDVNDLTHKMLNENLKDEATRTLIFTKTMMKHYEAETDQDVQALKQQLMTDIIDAMRKQSMANDALVMSLLNRDPEVVPDDGNGVEDRLTDHHEFPTHVKLMRPAMRFAADAEIEVIKQQNQPNANMMIEILAGIAEAIEGDVYNMRVNLANDVQETVMGLCQKYTEWGTLAIFPKVIAESLIRLVRNYTDMILSEPDSNVESVIETLKASRSEVFNNLPKSIVQNDFKQRLLDALNKTNCDAYLIDAISEMMEGEEISHMADAHEKILLYSKKLLNDMFKHEIKRVRALTP